jgi:hypothetical protein
VEESISPTRSLRFFGDFGRELPSLGAWNEATLWRGHFAGLADGPDFFAESFLGEQFRLDATGIVVRWDPETGEEEALGVGQEDWLNVAERNPADFVPAWLLRDWEGKNRMLLPTEHLVPRLPFVLGGEYDPTELVAVTAIASLKWRAQLAIQLRDLPDGERVRLTVEWDESRRN